MSILEPGQNCYKICNARRASLLVDSADYYAAFYETVRQAKQSLYIAGWDIDSRLDLLRSGNTKGSDPHTLGDFLRKKFTDTPAFTGYILTWDFSLIYLREREWTPLINKNWKFPRKLHFKFDDYHPLGASQHQKIVIVDNTVAFCGGMDLSSRRWDTSEHHVSNPDRVDPEGIEYGPVHDLQMMVDDEAARVLGDIFRERWFWATGKEIPELPVPEQAPWPSSVQPDAADIDIAVARTQSAYKRRPAVHEVKKLHLDAIEAAKTSIYIENQYVTSEAVIDALARSLDQEEGPEIVMVLPEQCHGWMEQSTMDAIRNKGIERLRQADIHKRLAVYYPSLENGRATLFVHSKFISVDGRFVMIGSANLSNRSMGFDTECNLAIESGSDQDSDRPAADFRNRLLAEHLACDLQTVEKAIREEKGLIRAIRSLSGKERTLKKLDITGKPPVEIPDLIKNQQLIDPESPLELDQIMDEMAEETGTAQNRGPLFKITAILIFIIGLAAAWKWTPLAEWITMERLVLWAQSIRDQRFALPIVLGAYVAGGLLVLPITLLISVTAIVFDTNTALVYACSGSLANALTCYGVGILLGRRSLHMLSGKRLNRLNKHIRQHGILAVIMLRNMPVAPFSIVNFIAGASRIKLLDFAIGTVIGMLPGIVVITLFSRRIMHVFHNPDILDILLTILIGCIIMGIGWAIQRRLSG